MGQALCWQDGWPQTSQQQCTRALRRLYARTHARTCAYTYTVDREGRRAQCLESNGQWYDFALESPSMLQLIRRVHLEYRCQFASDKKFGSDVWLKQTTVQNTCLTADRLYMLAWRLLAGQKQAEAAHCMWVTGELNERTYVPRNVMLQAPMSAVHARRVSVSRHCLLSGLYKAFTLTRLSCHDDKSVPACIHHTCQRGEYVEALHAECIVHCMLSALHAECIVC